MSATYTARGRINKQAYASNAEAWGTELNLGALERLDDMWGVVEVTVSGDVTLTSENAIADQSRSIVLILSGAGGATVTAPAVDKPYLVINNCTADVAIQPNAGTPATVRAGKASWYYTNAAGTIGYVIDPTLSDLKAATADIDAGSQKVVNVANATAANDAVNKGQVDGLKISDLNAPDASVAFGSQKITGLADGTGNNDAVNKSQLDGLLNLAPISTVAGIADDVSTVAGIAADVTSVDGNSTNINAVAANEININAVATNETNINTVASNDTNINTVAANDTDISTVATNDANVTTVADNIDDIVAAAAALDPYASKAEAEAGTAADRLMSPLRTKEAIIENGPVIVDTSSTSVTVTLPASPTNRERLEYIRQGANTVVIARNGNTIAGSTTDLTIDVDGYGVTLLYNSITGNWLVSGKVWA